VTACELVGGHLHFEGTYNLDIQREDGGIIVVRNVNSHCMNPHNVVTQNTAAALVFTVLRTPNIVHLIAVDKFNYNFYIRSTAARRK
jgi:hypothetical protein